MKSPTISSWMNENVNLDWQYDTINRLTIIHDEIPYILLQFHDLNLVSCGLINVYMCNSQNMIVINEMVDQLLFYALLNNERVSYFVNLNLK